LAAADHARGVAPAQARGAELHADQRVVGRERRAVLDEDARLAGAAGALPYRVALEVPLADAAAVGEKSFHADAPELRVGHPAVEVGHQIALGEHRIFGERRVAAHAPPAIAVMRGVFAHEGEKGGETLRAGRLYRIDAAVPRPPGLRHASDPGPPGRGRLDRIPGASLRASGRGRALRRSMQALLP